MFIVVQGVDGFGKSTSALHVASWLGAEFLMTPSTAARLYRDELVRSLGPSQEACQLFYLATLIAASAGATRLLQRGRSVVREHYFVSTQAYAAFRGRASISTHNRPSSCLQT
jgi:thymidylate kinase